MIVLILTLFERQVSVCLYAHTTVAPFMHDLDIVCKNVLTLISTCTNKLCFFSHWLKNPIIQMTSLDVTNTSLQYSKSKIACPDQCSI